MNVLAAALRNEYVAHGHVDEATHQRCVLRCFGQCAAATPREPPAFDVPRCLAECRDLCLTEHVVAPVPPAVSWIPFAACLFIAAVVALRMRYARIRLRTLIERYYAASSHEP
jgi:hypothetical protein